MSQPLCSDKVHGQHTAVGGCIGKVCGTDPEFFLEFGLNCYID